MAQLCAVDIAHSKVLDKVPVLGIAWAAPRIGNQCLTDWVDEMHPTLSILRVRIDDDSVTNGEDALHVTQWRQNLETRRFDRYGVSMASCRLRRIQADGVCLIGNRLHSPDRLCACASLLGLCFMVLFRALLGYRAHT